MPVSVVVGGQYGSEGKGKVALEWVRRDPNVTLVVRPGGTNSGHTAYTKNGRRLVLRQLPAAAVDGGVKVVLPPGSYIDVGLLKQEIAQLGLPESSLFVDPRAHLISQEHVAWERDAALTTSIGSTGSGTGAAVLSRLARMSAGSPPAMVASEEAELLPYIKDTAEIMRDALSAGQRILIEGTQGFGLSPIHGEAWPKCTARDTTAAAFLSEAGLSPMDVDEVVLVLRCHPIRVAGDSGPLVGETSWETIRQESGSTFPLDEYTSVTGRLRRVGHFDAELVSKAINANQPTRIVLNHLDYIDCAVRGTAQLTPLAEHFIDRIERSIGRRITDYGTGPATVAQRCIAAESIS